MNEAIQDDDLVVDGVTVVSDPIRFPPHYTRCKIEPIRFIAENGLDWFQGNVVKYVCRHDAKNGIEDLKKAQRYLENVHQVFVGGCRLVEGWPSVKVDQTSTFHRHTSSIPDD